MNQPTDTPMISVANSPIPWGQAMVDAITHPSALMFAALARNPNARASTGLWWVFAGGSLSAVISVLFGLLFDRFANVDMSAVTPGSAGLALLCVAPFAGVITVILFVVLEWLQNTIARGFGGTGTFEQLVYAEAAFIAPLTVITAILGAIPIVNIVNIPLGLYALVLTASALKGVHGFGWGKAINTLLVIIVLIVLIVAVVLLVILILIGPALGQVYTSMNEL